MARYKTESCSATCVTLRKSEIKVSRWVSDVKSGQDWKCGFGKSGMAMEKKDLQSSCEGEAKYFVCLVR